MLNEFSNSLHPSSSRPAAHHSRGGLVTALVLALVPSHQSLVTVFAAQLPSLFRGVVVADSPIGIRVVSVEGSSQAYLADLRPEDIIVQINDTPIRSIDEFAVVSQALRGKATKARVFVLRHGQPLELMLHLYSYPILRHWDLTFVPEHDIRFAEASTGFDYWARLGRGFETAGNLEQALNAYLNALHNEPAQLDMALKVSELLWRIAQMRLSERRLPEALVALQQGVVILGRLFDRSLNTAQLKTIQYQLINTLHMIQKYRSET